MTGQEALDFMNSDAKVIYNFLILRSNKHKWIPNIFRRWIPVVYIDSADGCEYLGDPVLTDHHVRIRYDSAMSHPTYSYECIIAKVHRDDLDKFIAAMDALLRKHLLLGHTDYIKCCVEIILRIADLKSVNLKAREV